ncbi:MAG: HAMP domain-containing protein [Hungatella sp.]|nr:HAMP domain-containing protein [Hungatella sp.]
MKNLKVGKKFLVSFGMILTMFLIAVASAGIGIVRSKGSYENFYTEGYKAVSAVYDIQLKLQTGLKELMLAVLESDPAETNKRVEAVNESMGQVVEDLQWVYDNYSGDVSLLRDFETKMTNNKELRMRAIEYAQKGTPEGNEEAQNIILNEYNPMVESYTQILEEAAAKMERESQNQYDESMTLLNILLGVSVGISVIAFIITVIIALNLTGNILIPVKKIEDAMREVVKGNLSVKVDYQAEDEFGEMAEYMYEMTSGVGTIIKDIETILTAMSGGDFAAKSSDRSKYIGDYQKILQAMRGIKSSLNTTMTTLNQSANQVASGSDQVSSGAQALSQGATEQASSVEQLAASINDISSRINENARGAQEASKKSVMVSEVAGEGNRMMQDMLAAMADINASSGEIGKIIKTIEDIAFQTNILALNAAVEAARAGAAGKGFAVVADEVRNLASKSAEASKNTAVLIENSLTAVENGKKIADETAKSLEQVMAGIQEATDMMDAIAKASKDQAEAITQITLGIDQISSVVQTNSATSEESAAASEELSSQAQIMRELVRRFKLEGDSESIVSQVPQYDSGYSSGGTQTAFYSSYDDGKY